MKQERKEDLKYRFPPVPADIYEQMKGRGAMNFCIFLANGKELFVRGFHRYSHGELLERQRYVFDKDGCVRYIYDDWDNTWRIASKFREPYFRSTHGFGGYAERHFKGQTTIVFLRKTDDPDKPYYTMELDKTGKIKQCRGYRNNMADNPKPPEIKTFEQHYEQYLQEVIHGKRNECAVQQSA